MFRRCTELTKIIKTEFDIPVIFITGNSDEQTKKRALLTKPIAYLQKPIFIESLCTLINEAMIGNLD